MLFDRVHVSDTHPMQMKDQSKNKLHLQCLILDSFGEQFSDHNIRGNLIHMLDNLFDYKMCILNNHFGFGNCWSINEVIKYGRNLEQSIVCGLNITSLFYMKLIKLRKSIIISGTGTSKPLTIFSNAPNETKDGLGHYYDPETIKLVPSEEFNYRHHSCCPNLDIMK